MILYFYDRATKEYLYSDEVDIKPVPISENEKGTGKAELPDNLKDTGNLKLSGDSKNSKDAGELKLPKHSTLIKPEDGLYDPYFDEKYQKWLGLSEEEWIEKHKGDPVEEVQPSETDQAIADLILSQAQTKVEQDQINATNMLDIATIKSQLNGGTN